MEATEQLAPQTKPHDPQYTQWGMSLPASVSGGVKVNEDTALTLGSVWACVRVIAESLSGLPWLVYRRRRDGGRDLQNDHPLNWILDIQPNPEMTAFTFRETMLAHVLTWGNAFAEIERSAAGPTWLWPITPDRVEVHRINGDIWYEVSNEGAPPTWLSSDEMLHIRGLGFDGLVGYSVIKMAARSVGLGIAIDEASSQLFSNDSTPGGVLKHPGRLSDTARANLIESWQKRHGGPYNRRKVAVIEEGMDWVQTGLPPEDSQLIQQRQFTATEICRWFRVPPHKIADLSRATFSNIEHQSIEFVEDTLRPWAERLESEANVKLFGRNNRGTLETIIDLEERKRGDTASRSAYYVAMFDRGILSINEVRQRENLNPIGPDGDKRFVPMNMVLLDKAGEEPVASDTPPQDEPEVESDADDEQEGGDEADETLARIRESAMLAIEDGCRRMLAKEHNSPPSDQAKLAEWLEKQRVYGRKALLPAVRVLADSYGVNRDAAACVALEAFLVAYISGRDGYMEPVQLAEQLRDCVLKAEVAG